MAKETKEYSIEVIETQVEIIVEQLSAIEGSDRFNVLSIEQKLQFLRTEIQLKEFIRSLEK